MAYINVAEWSSDQVTDWLKGKNFGMSRRGMWMGLIREEKTQYLRGVFIHGLLLKV